MTADGDLMTVLRVVASLVAVVALVALAARFARRAGVSGEGAGLRVVDRIGITRETAVAVVEVAGRGLVVGTGAHGVSLLAELDAEELAAARQGRRRDSGRVSVTRVVAPQRPASATVPAPRPASPPPAAPAGTSAAQPATPQPVTPRPATSRNPVPRQGSGAVLDPRTWRATVDALRELTVRRG